MGGGTSHFRASPLREALPYLSHRSPPPPSPTCILKPPCSPGIGPGRVLRAQKLEPGGWGGEEGAWPHGWTKPSLRHPPRAPRPSRTPPDRSNQTGGRAGPRLERASGRAPGGPSHRVGEPRGPAVPLLTSLSEAGSDCGAPPPLRPRWAGRLGLRERGRGRASACCARARRARAPRPPSQPPSPFPSPEARAGSRVTRAGVAGGNARRCGAGRTRPRPPPARAWPGPEKPRRGERRPGAGEGDVAVTAPPWRSPRRWRRRLQRRRRRS